MNHNIMFVIYNNIHKHKQYLLISKIDVLLTIIILISNFL